MLKFDVFTQRNFRLVCAPTDIAHPGSLLRMSRHVSGQVTTSLKLGDADVTGEWKLGLGDVVEAMCSQASRVREGPFR